MNLTLTSVQAIILKTAVQNEIYTRERICQEHQIGENALNIRDLYEVLRELEHFIEHGN